MVERIDAQIHTGLTAQQVQARVEAGTVNGQTDKNEKSYFQIVAGNIFTFFNLINVVLALLILSVGSYKNLLFTAVILSNTCIGIFQEVRAKRTLDRLSLIFAAKASVIRDGHEQKIGPAELVIDDIMVLCSGNQICADAVVCQGRVEVDEALLTGESDAVLKNPGDALYSGSFIVSGKAHARVRHVGKDNYAEQITLAAKAQKRHPSELRCAMDRILKFVSVLIVPLGVGLFLRQYYAPDASLERAVVGTVAAVLGMIPEGLVLLTSISLAVGAIHLARRKTLVRELYCLETLARVDVLCLDKTGTLTEGKMRLKEVVPLEDIAMSEVMGNLVRVLPDENATSLALRAHFEPRDHYHESEVIPFSSARKYGGAHFDGHGTYILGAFEFVFPNAEYPDIRAQSEAYASQGVRVVVLAHSDHAAKGAELPEGLRPCALLILSDIVRSDAKETLQFFSKQGVSIMVISGDHPATAAHIAAEAGLEGADRAVDATTLTTPESLSMALLEYRVFGRVTPQQKKEIVALLKTGGHTVAMTGDGVNDVPALKEADCSIAMAQGSDAAKSCANLVLLDSHFRAMPDIVNEGRRVINNIQSASSLFLVKTIFSIVLTMLMLISGTPYPFMPIHLTVIGACAVGIPTFILSLEPNFEKMKAGFFRHVLRNALTGALTIILYICLVTSLTARFGYTEITRTTMCMILTGVVSLLMIGRVYPLTSAARKIVFFAMTGLFLCCLVFFRDLLSLAALQLAPAGILLALTSAAPFMLEGIGRLLKLIKDPQKATPLS